MTGFKRFPFDNFTYYFTLMSECFSSFHHCTCSLSVSRLYLALEEIYLPFRAAIPNNPTLWNMIVTQGSEAVDGVLTLYDSVFQRELDPGPARPYTSSLQLALVGDFHLELFPLHSPLLRESLLVSFPPLINMLKFRGSSYFTSGQIVKIFAIVASEESLLCQEKTLQSRLQK